MQRRGLSPDATAAIRTAIEGAPDDAEPEPRRRGISPETAAAIRATVAPRPE